MCLCFLQSETTAKGRTKQVLLVGESHLADREYSGPDYKIEGGDEQYIRRGACIVRYRRM